MKRKVQFLYAGHGGKPIYVYGYLTDEHDSSPRTLLFEVTKAEPESRPKPGVYRAADLPGGWMTLLPDRDQTPQVKSESDRSLVQAARAAGFPIREA
jgi:hypothetical protein